MFPFVRILHQWLPLVYFLYNICHFFVYIKAELYWMASGMAGIVIGFTRLPAARIPENTEPGGRHPDGIEKVGHRRPTPPGLPGRAG